MTFWAIILVVAGVFGLWLARPFLRRGGVELAGGEQAISIYRDQIDALDRDVESGLISGAERAGAEREIETRTLRAAREFDNNLLAPRISLAAALGVATVAIVGSGFLYGWLGAPAVPDQPLAGRRAPVLERQAEAAEPQTTAKPIERERAEAPESFEEWWTLARTRSASGDHAAAAEAYRKAAEASGDRPSVLSAYAEALTLANGNKVPPAAKIIFGQVLVRQPLDPRARYYTALGRAQAQDFDGALADWLSLYVQSAPDAPWASTVRRDILNMARFTRTPIEQILPDATAEEIAFATSAPPEPVPEQTQGQDRIAEIEAELATQPKNYELSMELARLYAGSGQTDKAGAALDDAQAQYPGAPYVQQQLADVSRELGLAPAPGPTDADVAAAATMTEDERSEMVRGMVAGLAARLQAEPEDLDGWLMLIRSYAVLQDAENAKSAARNAYAYFDGKPEQRAAIQATAAEFGISPM